ncbi:cysteine transferase [Novosphingobium barchaimii LL02]|uniref:Cysteine transferase n=1 Tax=Novosphingobium barchaimii LL02 TaxID=1114963 RepID=A0A0J7Y7H3_9SPHN|nr:VOC family protein [Novosphingobium barchaimii]KMS59592.1 cysteine transferase [Novosphingobium barchaimii LL02]
MGVELNHTIVWCRDRQVSADFFAAIYGLAEPFDLFRFRVVKLANGVSLDFAEKHGLVAPQHYAMLVDESTFDAVLSRIEARGLTYWADPMRTRAGEINRNDGGRGLYFEDPDGHVLEALTVPYGGFARKDEG